MHPARTCYRCRAFRIQSNGAACSLGYRIADGAPLLGRIVSGKPLEDCPKPQTVAAYVAAVRDANGTRAQH